MGPILSEVAFLFLFINLWFDKIFMQLNNRKKNLWKRLWTNELQEIISTHYGGAFWLVCYVLFLVFYICSVCLGWYQLFVGLRPRIFIKGWLPVAILANFQVAVIGDNCQFSQKEGGPGSSSTTVNRLGSKREALYWNVFGQVLRPNFLIQSRSLRP